MHALMLCKQGLIKKLTIRKGVQIKIIMNHRLQPETEM